MFDELFAILESYNVPVYRHGSMSNDEKYPDTFMTYRNLSTDPQSHYDNEEYSSVWWFEIYIYSRKLNTVLTMTEQLRTDLLSAGWVVTSHGFDAISDEPSHAGRGIEIKFLKKEGGQTNV